MLYKNVAIFTSRNALLPLVYIYKYIAFIKYESLFLICYMGPVWETLSATQGAVPVTVNNPTDVIILYFAQ